MFALKLCHYDLTNRELKILLFRYYCRLSLRKTGKILNGEISYGRVHQIEQKVLNKIKINLTKRKSQDIL